MKFALKNQKGFSLVELMIVVGIIGILATLALPRFKQFQAKAKMGEAKNILSHIYTLEQTYSLDNNQYLAFAGFGAQTGSLTGNDCTPPANAQTLGFRIDPCQNTAPIPRYRYTAVAAAGQFIGSAQTGAANTNRICPHPQNPAHFLAINETNLIWGTQGNAPGAAATVPPNPAIEPSVGSVCQN